MTDAGLSVPHKHTRTRVTAHEFVRETLREGILDGSIPGGTRLVQADLAEQLSVSTTPVREALRDLAAEGIVELDAHRGGTVHRISKTELQEIYELRLVLEVVAVEKAAERMTPEQLAQVGAVLEQMQAAHPTADWVMLNRDFHMTIYEAAGSPRLLAILRTLLDTSVMYVSMALKVRPRAREQATRDHQRIFEALSRHDAEVAAVAVREHLEIPRSVLEVDLRS